MIGTLNSSTPPPAPSNGTAVAWNKAMENVDLAWYAVNWALSNWNAPIYLEDEELLSSALYGIAKAAESYTPDHSSGAKWGTYAYKLAKHELISQLRLEQKQFVARLRGNTYQHFCNLTPSGEVPDLPGNHNEDEEQILNRVEVQRLLQLLPDRLRWVVEQHYFEERTLAEIGRDLGVSRERARQLHREALKRMRRAA